MKPNALKNRMHDQGFADISDFIRRSGVRMSAECARKAIYEHKAISAPLLIDLMLGLGYSRSQIKEALIEAGDKVLYRVIGNDPDRRLMPWEETWLEIGSRLRSG